MKALKYALIGLVALSGSVAVASSRQFPKQLPNQPIENFISEVVNYYGPSNGCPQGWLRAEITQKLGPHTYEADSIKTGYATTFMWEGTFVIQTDTILALEPPAWVDVCVKRNFEIRKVRLMNGFDERVMVFKSTKPSIDRAEIRDGRFLNSFTTANAATPSQFENHPKPCSWGYLIAEVKRVIQPDTYLVFTTNGSYRANAVLHTRTKLTNNQTIGICVTKAPSRSVQIGERLLDLMSFKEDTAADPIATKVDCFSFDGFSMPTFREVKETLVKATSPYSSR